ncbi:MAG TPA: flagellar biosynthetic protein FliO [Polyangia bacterium]|nr:flagellar biosynthetic protein FliO [Polyangia bacterium]
MDGALVSTTVALVVVCALAVGALRALGRRGGRARGMRLVSRLAVEPRRSLVVVEVAGRWFLVGVGDGPMSLLSELDAAEARAQFDPAPDSSTAKSAFAAALRRVLGGAR